MDREGGLPPWVVAGLVVVVLAVGALSYYAGRFKADGSKSAAEPLELPEPGAPSPDVEGSLPTPGEVPPTVTPSGAVLIEKAPRSPSGGLVERSSEVVVPIASDRIPTARPSPFVIQDPGPRSRIELELPPAPRPSPTPTVPDLEERPREEPALENTPEPPRSLAPPSPPPEPLDLLPTPAPEETPEAGPTPRTTGGVSPRAWAA